MSIERRRIRVQVTQADIDAGQAGQVRACPLALALCRNYPEARVTGFGTWFVAGGKTYPLSEDAREFVFRVDTKKPVQPATFVIEGPAR